MLQLNITPYANNPKYVTDAVYFAPLSGQNVDGVWADLWSYVARAVGRRKNVVRVEAELLMNDRGYNIIKYSITREVGDDEQEEGAAVTDVRPQEEARRAVWGTTAGGGVTPLG